MASPCGFPNYRICSVFLMFICNFEPICTPDDDRDSKIDCWKSVTVWTRPGQLHTADYALRIAPKILRFYEDFFGLQYPLPKMDMIALPDFNAGAMENWGLITYRETVMLVDEKKASVINKEYVANVVAHELAHQWFGNLVTPKWWDDLWLNEGFASFVEYWGVNHIEPHWKLMDKFSFDTLQVALKADSLSNSHPISVPVGAPEEISEIFDSISYNKGASIIRMLMEVLTTPVMKQGLSNYLSAFKYSNAEQSDLWTYLHAALPKSEQEIDVAKVMNSWTLQTGYPLVTLKRRYDSSQSATLEQHRYRSYSTKSNITSLDKNNNVEVKWEIPITYTYKSESYKNSSSTRTRFWMHQKDPQFLEVSSQQLPAKNDEWVLLNVDQVGFYRVNYDERNWQLIIEQLKRDHTKISSANRAQIMTDLMEMAKSGILNYTLPMEATKYLAADRDWIPWDASLSSLDYIDTMLQRSGMYGDWLDYMSQVLEPFIAPFRHIKWTIDANDDRTTRLNDLIDTNKYHSAIVWSCQIGDKHCVDQAKRLFQLWKVNGTNNIEPLLRYTTYCSAISHGTKAEWDFLWQKYLKEETAHERDRMMKALSCTREPWLLIRYLELSFDGNHNVRRQDAATVIKYIARNEHGREIAFNFVRENWSTLIEFYGKSSFTFSGIIRSISRSMNTETDLRQVMDFYEMVKNDLGSGRRNFQLTLEEIAGNVAWRKRNFKFFANWLKEFKSTNKSTNNN